MLDLEQTMQEHPVLGILRNIPLDKTIDYADAAIRGGVSFFEVALNSPCALQQIEMLRDKFGEQCLVGAGTAITPELCQQAIATGAQFLLTPGTPQDVLRYCRDHEIALLPGVLTPTDVAVSMEYGYHAMKLFPAGSMPLRYLKDLQGPFDKTQFMAIGGVPDAQSCCCCWRLADVGKSGTKNCRAGERCNIFFVMKNYFYNHRRLGRSKGICWLYNNVGYEGVTTTV